MDDIQQGVEDLLSGKITPKEYIDIVRKDGREQAEQERQAVKRIAGARRRSLTD